MMSIRFRARAYPAEIPAHESGPAGAVPQPPYTVQPSEQRDEA